MPLLCEEFLLSEETDEDKNGSDLFPEKGFYTVVSLLLEVIRPNQHSDAGRGSRLYKERGHGLVSLNVYSFLAVAD